jgi:uncharacterized protein YciI
MQSVVSLGGADMYLLVMLSPARREKEPAEMTQRHVKFITELIRRNRILLGGGLEDSAKPRRAAYLLNVSSLKEGRSLVLADPFVQEGAYSATVVEWKLVGINPDSIDQALVVHPKQV